MARKWHTSAKIEFEVAGNEYTTAEREMNRADGATREIEDELTTARMKEATARDARDSLRNKADARKMELDGAMSEVTKFEELTKQEMAGAEQQVTILSHKLKEFEENARRILENWFGSLIEFTDNSWRKLRDIVAPWVASASDSGMNFANEGRVDRRDSATRNRDAPRQAIESANVCIPGYSPPSTGGHTLVSFTLAKFAQYARNELESESFAVPWVQRANSSSDGEGEANLGGLASPRVRTEVLPDHPPASVQLAEHMDILGSYPGRLEGVGDLSYLTENDIKNLATVSNLFIVLDQWARQLEMMASAEDGGDVESDPMVGESDSEVYENTYNMSSSTEPIAGAPLLTQERLDGFRSTLDEVANRVEVLESAVTHVERMKKRETDLRVSLNSAMCRVKELRVEIAAKRDSVNDEYQARQDDWNKAMDEERAAEQQYGAATQRVEKLESEYLVALAEGRERRQKFDNAEKKRDRTASEMKEREAAFVTIQEEHGNLAETVGKLRNHLGRASGLSADYQFTARRVREQIPRYLDKDLEFVHVLDGGVADNLGVTPLLEVLESFPTKFRVEREHFSDFDRESNRVMVISVDARIASDSDFGKTPESPSLVSTVRATVSTAIQGKSTLLTRELEQATRGLVKDGIVSERYLVKVNFDSVRDFHMHENDGLGGHVHGRETTHDESSRGNRSVNHVSGLNRCIKAFKNIPTDWDLEQIEKDALVKIGYALVRDSLAYKRFVEDLGGIVPPNQDSVNKVCSDFVTPLERVAIERKEKKDRWNKKQLEQEADGGG